MSEKRTGEEPQEPKKKKVDKGRGQSISERDAKSPELKKEREKEARRVAEATRLLKAQEGIAQYMQGRTEAVASFLRINYHVQQWELENIMAELGFIPQETKFVRGRSQPVEPSRIPKPQEKKPTVIKVVGTELPRSHDGKVPHSKSDSGSSAVDDQGRHGSGA